MKKWIGMILAVLMAVSLQTPVFAADAGQQESQQPKAVTVSLSTIEQIMKQYNRDIQTISNNLSETRHDYDLSDDDATKNAYRVALVQYDEKVSQQILNAKQDYVNYCADCEQLTADQTISDNYQNKLLSYQRQVGSGYMSQKDYNDYLEKAQKAKSDLQAQSDKVTREKKDLITLLNIPDSVPYTIAPISDSDVDVNSIANIRFSEDTISMFNSNADIIAAEMNYNYEKDDNLFSTGFSVDNAKITLEQTKTQVTAAFKKLYDSLMDSYRTYQQQASSVQTKANELATEKIKLSKGYTTPQKVDELNADLLSAKSILATDRSNLFMDYFKYTNMKSGYSVSSSGSMIS